MSSSQARRDWSARSPSGPHDGGDPDCVRGERKQHGLQRWVEGPEIAPGERALVVEDTVTSGKSFVTAIERIKEEGIEIAAAVSVVDRLAGGRDAIQDALGPSAPYRPLFTIDDIYPDRPDR